MNMTIKKKAGDDSGRVGSSNIRAKKIAKLSDEIFRLVTARRRKQIEEIAAQTAAIYHNNIFK